MDTKESLLCVHLIFLFALCCQYSAVKVFAPCMSTQECPANTTCTFRGCDGKICLCDDNLLPFANDTQCVQSIELGAPCSGSDPCRGPNSHCQDGRCQCLQGHQLVASNVGWWCKQKFFGHINNAAHGEYCDSQTVCSQTFLTCGPGNKCGCIARYRPATASEINADPYKTEQCRPDSFQLGRPVNITGSECPAKVTTTTTITTSTTSTTTPIRTPTTPSTTISTTTTATTETSRSTTPSTTTTPTTTTIPSTTTTSSTTVPSTTTIPSTTTYVPITTTTTTSTVATTTFTPTTTTTVIQTPSPTTTASTTPTTSKPTTTAARTHSSSSPATTNSISSSSLSTTSPTESTIRHSSSSLTSAANDSTSISASATLPQSASKSTQTSTTSPTASLPSTPISVTQAQAHESTTTMSLNTSSRATSSLHTSPPSSAGTAASSTVSGSVLRTTPCTNQQQTAKPGTSCTSCSCPGNASCEEDRCHVSRCRCDLGYAPSPDNTECWKLSALGEPCTDKRLCQGLYTTCSGDGVCECQEEYERSDSGRWCRLEQSWFVKFPVFGEKCTGGFTADCYFDFEQECVDGRCRCKAGLRDVTDLDKQAVYPDLVQCRNASYSKGHREKDICENMSRTKYGANLYDHAKEKIRKMQGAIIGGCIGGAAFIGLVIGAVVLIRWKRRGRMETIRDTSSTASTEGTTSRYSFKIPRPFAHFIHAKDYESRAITYPSSVYEGDGQSMTHEPDILTTNNIDDHMYHVGSSTSNNTSNNT